MKDTEPDRNTMRQSRYDKGMMRKWGQKVQRGRSLIDGFMAVQQAGMATLLPPPPICSSGLLMKRKREKAGASQSRDPSSHHAIPESEPLLFDFYMLKQTSVIMTHSLDYG